MILQDNWLDNHVYVFQIIMMFIQLNHAHKFTINKVYYVTIHVKLVSQEGIFNWRHSLTNLIQHLIIIILVNAINNIWMLDSQYVKK